MYVYCVCVCTLYRHVEVGFLYLLRQGLSLNLEVATGLQEPSWLLYEFFRSNSGCCALRVKHFTNGTNCLTSPQH